jgi:hypothetical protein
MTDLMFLPLSSNPLCKALGQQPLQHLRISNHIDLVADCRTWIMLTFIESDKSAKYNLLAK